jgi:hypothetical protein
VENTREVSSTTNSDMLLSSVNSEPVVNKEIPSGDVRGQEDIANTMTTEPASLSRLNNEAELSSEFPKKVSFSPMPTHLRHVFATHSLKLISGFTISSGSSCDG